MTTRSKVQPHPHRFRVVAVQEEAVDKLVLPPSARPERAILLDPGEECNIPAGSVIYFHDRGAMELNGYLVVEVDSIYAWETP